MTTVIIAALLAAALPQDTSKCEAGFFDGPVPFKVSTAPQFANRDSVKLSIDEAFKSVVAGTNDASTHVAIGTDDTGKVQRVIVSRSSSNENADSAAVGAARRFVFRPATYNGSAVCAWITLPIRNPKRIES